MFTKGNYLIYILVLMAGFAKAQIPVIEIWEIQGDQNSSPYNNEVVESLANIVTAVGVDRFYMQTPIDRSDNIATTSDGILVYTNSSPNLEVGDLVNVTGLIQEYESMTEFATEGLSYEVLASNQVLPDPVLIDADFPSGIAQTVHELERVEGMRVQVVDAVATGPTSYGGTPFVAAGRSRVFRESGINYPGQNGLPVWDSNPELFWFYPQGLGIGNSPELSTAATINAVGVLNASSSRYTLYPTTYEANGAVFTKGVREKQNREVTIGSLNTLVFTDDESEFDIRLKKMSDYIVQLLNAPDILALQELEDFNVLQKLADKINELYPDVYYTPYSFGVSSGSFSIHNGYLVRRSVIDVTITALGANSFLSIGGRLHDRPPLLLEGYFSTDPPTPINVLNVHIRSLNGIEGNNASFVRTKRHEQAISIANMIKAKRDQNLVIVGDFNAHAFSDGYVDVMNQITGSTSEGAIFPVDPINDPPITNHNLSLPESEQYSYVFDGNAQMLDHCLSTELENLSIKGMEFARGNSDNPSDNFDNPNNTLYVSDHDGFVFYLQLESDITELPIPQFSGSLSYPNPFLPNHRIYLELERGDNVLLQLFSLDGKLLFHEEQGFFDKGKVVLSPSFPETEGMYIIRVAGFHFDESGKIFIMDDL